MTTRLVQVSLSGLVTLAIIGTAIFFILRILPGDVALQIAGDGAVTQEDLATIRRQLGTDRPLLAQYVDWVGSLLRADPGLSMVQQQSIIDEFKKRFPLTLELALLSALTSIAIGLPTGLLASVQRRRPAGYVARILGIIGLAMPVFWTGTLVLLLLLKFAEWTPPVGYRTFTQDAATHIQQMILPVLVMGAGGAALLSRMTAGAADDVLRQDYVRTARAKGLTSRTVLVRHVLRNALLPVITVLGYQFAFLLGGAVVTERLFGLPGLGTWFVEAINQRDYPVVQFLVMFYVTVAVAVNVLVDLSYGVIDPRTR